MAIVKVEKNRYTVDTLYQWDKDQVLEIYGLSLASIPEIHFTNAAMDGALVRQATMNDAGVISVEVPNSVLQKPYKITVYVCTYENEAFKTLYSMVIPVEARSKPTDYTIEVTDEEVYSFNALENKIDNILAVSLVRYDEVNAKYEATDQKYTQAVETLVEANNTLNQAIDEVNDTLDQAIDEINLAKESAQTSAQNASASAQNAVVSATAADEAAKQADSFAIEAKTAEQNAALLEGLARAAEETVRINAQATATARAAAETARDEAETARDEAENAAKNAALDAVSNLSQLEPVFVNTIDECTDTTKLYVLPDGYIYAYMYTEVSEEVIAYTNRLPLSVDSDGNAYNGGKGWKADTRLNSSGVETSYTGIECTGFIPVKRGDIIRFKNFGFIPDGDYKSQQYTSIYDSNKTKLISFISNVISGTYSDYGGVERDEVGNMILLRTDAIPIDGSAAQSEHEAFAFPENTAFVRFSAEEITDDTIITVNEEISATTVTTKEYAWANTGHAFVPADYEDRIVAVEESIIDHETRISNLENTDENGVSDYVISEAENVIDRVIAAQGERTFTFAAITDMHYGNGSYTDGLKHACQAMKYIDERIKLDMVAVLGDYTDGLTGSGYDDAIGDFKAINAEMDGLRFAPNVRIHGNHDYYETHSPILYRYIPAYSDNVVWGSKLGGYFYRDFEDFKLRIICLNTAEENSNGLSCSTKQYNWFVDALNLSDKEDVTEWQILILSHHPLDWFHGNNSGYLFWQILNAYLSGTSWSRDDGLVSCDFTGKNSAKLIGNIHGHIHNLLTRNIAAGQPNITDDTIDVVRIATPEACYGRPNSYNGSWDHNPFGEETDYPKTQGTAADTAFCVYCIDLDTNTVKAICYGAGYDREISY